MRVSRFGLQALVLGTVCSLLAGCVFPGSVKTTIKVGLSAPFEGVYRDLGYEVLNAVRLSVRQRNQAGGVDGRYLVEQVALNDFGETGEAAQQAREMAVDPGVVGVLGGWSPQTFAVAGPAYRQAGLAFVAPQMDPGTLASAAAQVIAGDGPVRRAVILHSQDPADVALSQAFADAFVLEGGSIADDVVPAGDNWVQPLDLDGEHPPEVVFMAGDAVRSAGWMVAVRDAGFEGTLLGGPALGSSIVVDIAGLASEGAIFVSPFPPAIHDPAFVDAYRQLSGGVSPGPAASWAYVAANRLLDTIDRAVKERETSLRTVVQKIWTTEAGGPDQIYTYVIQSGNSYSLYPSH